MKLQKEAFVQIVLMIVIHESPHTLKCTVDARGSQELHLRSIWQQ
jgi:hypothetical protein